MNSPVASGSSLAPPLLIAERATAVRRAAERANERSRLNILEMGKLVSEPRLDVSSIAQILNYFANIGERSLATGWLESEDPAQDSALKV